jgi:hypothetical protein
VHGNQPGLAPDHFRPKHGGLMLVHTVVFWLKPELTEAQRAEFVAALEALRAVPSVSQYFIGTPADGVAPRPVVDKTFDYTITCLFEDIAAHDAYQVHPLHVAFVEQGKPKWTQVKIYDAD